MLTATHWCQQIAVLCVMQVTADTFIYTPLNVGLFFAWITVVEGGGWTVGRHRIYLCALQTAHTNTLTSSFTLGIGRPPQASAGISAYHGS